MAWKVKRGGGGGGSEGDYTLPPEGTHVGVVFEVADMGMLEVTRLDGKSAIRQHVGIRLQLDEPDELTGQRAVVEQLFTLSFHEKAALTSIFSALLGHAPTEEDMTAFEQSEGQSILGHCCLVEIAHKLMSGGGKVAQVRGFMAKPKKVPAIEADETCAPYHGRKFRLPPWMKPHNPKVAEPDDTKGLPWEEEV